MEQAFEVGPLPQHFLHVKIRSEERAQRVTLDAWATLKSFVQPIYSQRVGTMIGS